MGWGLSTAAQNLLAQVQGIFGADNVIVTSGQSSRIGVAGGSPTSQHPSGNAFDFHVKGYSPDQVQSIIAQSGIQFGQSIQEYGAAAGAGLNHLGVGTKGQLLTGVNGRYSTTGYASQVAATAQAQVNKTLGDAINSTLGPWAGKLSNALGTGLAAPGNAIEGAVKKVTPDFNAWFTRITYGILAILLIMIAFYMLAQKAGVEIPTPQVIPA